MITVKNILVPIDFSQSSENALEYALSIFGRDNQVVFHLMYSFDSSINTGTLISVFDVLKQDVLRKVELVFREKERELNLQGTKLICVAESVPFFTLLRLAAKEYDIDMIVMGVDPETVELDKMSSNKTSKTIKSALCPVIAVPSNSRLKLPLKVLLAVDYKSSTDLDLLEPLKELAIRFNGHIEVLYVKSGNVDVNQGEARAVFDNYFGDIDHTYHYVEGMEVSKVIEDYMHLENVNMVVTMPGKRNLFDDVFHKSVTNKLVLHTDLPLMALHKFA